MYTVSYHREHNLLDITWTGLLTPKDMIEYAEECRACQKREGFQDGYRLRIVLNDSQPLPQDTLAALSFAFPDFPKASRAAMVTRSAISRMQIKRALLMPQMEIFDSSEAAFEWLLLR